MAQPFQLVGLDHAQFEPLFRLSDKELMEHHAERHLATESPGYPCRVSLQDAKVGEELLLLSFLHQPAASPYHASGPIFVRRGAKQRRLEVGEVSSYVTSRLMSVRGYDKAHMIVAASVCDGVLLAKELETYFSNDQVDYIHLHNAKQGCFSCQVIRA